MKKSVVRSSSLLFLMMLILNVFPVAGQNDLNSTLRKMASEHITSSMVNLTTYNIFSCPEFDPVFTEKHKLIELDFDHSNSVASYDEADCKFILYREWEKVNMLLVIYFPSKTEIGDPTLQFSTISKDGKVIDRQLIKYEYFIDPSNQFVQILNLNNNNQFEMITRQIQRVMVDNRFVAKEEKEMSEKYVILEGKIINSKLLKESNMSRL
jgi:hypothetical protein